MNGVAIKAAFDGLDDQYKQILARDNKDALTQVVQKVNSAVNGDSSKLAPEPDNIFNAFRITPWNKLSVILIGQDPYPTPGDAMGLCFSVNRGRPIPRSLANIYKALICSKIIDKMPTHGDISSWGKQGVLMLNMSLTTLKSQRGSHLNIWQAYVEKILTDITTKCALDGRPLVFIMWGTFAQKFHSIVDKVNFHSIQTNGENATVHRIIEWGHPSPVSKFNKGDPDEVPKHFANCDNFTACNTILESFGRQPINWNPDIEIQNESVDEEGAQTVA